MSLEQAILSQENRLIQLALGYAYFEHAQPKCSSSLFLLLNEQANQSR